MMIDCNLEKSYHFKVMKRKVKMLFSCFGGAAVRTGTAGSRRQRMEDARAEDLHGGGGGGMERRVKRKLVVVGDGECGKTCLLQRFCRDTYNAHGYLPTVFDTDVIDVQLDKTTTVELMITDTAGQEDYDRLRPYSYPDADVVIVCFALDNPDSLENVRLNWIPEIRHFCGANVPVLLVGNKMDLRSQGELIPGDESSISSEDFLDFPGCLPSASLIKQGPVKVSSAKRVAAEVGAEGYWETSALLDQGVAEVFQAASRVAMRQQSSSLRRSSAKSCKRRGSFLERIGVKRRS